MKNLFNISAVILAGAAFFLFLFAPLLKDRSDKGNISFLAHHEGPGYENNLKKPGVKLTTGGKPNAHFVPVVVAGNLAFCLGTDQGRRTASLSGARLVMILQLKKATMLHGSS